MNVLESRIRFQLVLRQTFTHIYKMYMHLCMPVCVLACLYWCMLSMSACDYYEWVLIWNESMINTKCFIAMCVRISLMHKLHINPLAIFRLPVRCIVLSTHTHSHATTNAYDINNNPLKRRTFAYTLLWLNCNLEFKSIRIEFIGKVERQWMANNDRIRIISMCNAYGTN